MLNDVRISNVMLKTKFMTFFLNMSFLPPKFPKSETSLNFIWNSCDTKRGNCLTLFNSSSHYPCVFLHTALKYEAPSWECDPLRRLPVLSNIGHLWRYCPDPDIGSMSQDLQAAIVSPPDSLKLASSLPAATLLLVAPLRDIAVTLPTSFSPSLPISQSITESYCFCLQNIMFPCMSPLPHLQTRPAPCKAQLVSQWSPNGSTCSHSHFSRDFMD